MGKLTKKQNAIIRTLQKGGELVFDSGAKTILCCSSKGHFQFSHVLFWKLTKMGLIAQGMGPHFNHGITKKGMEIETSQCRIKLADGQTVKL